MEENSPSLRYRSLAEELRQELLAGKFRAGDRFPSIRRLIEQTRRSLPTVRSALNMLVDEGLLQRHPRSGYFVTSLGANHASQGVRITVVTPAFSAPTEPWFTGRIISGFVNAAARFDARVSIIQRRPPPDARMTHHPDDVERIIADKPDGLVWLHYSPSDEKLLERLTSGGTPVVTTMRHWNNRRSRLVREDNWMFALQVVSGFQTLGHKNIGVVAQVLDDEYYASKLACLTEVGARLGVQIKPSASFVFDPKHGGNLDLVAQDFDRFVGDHPEVTGYVILDSLALIPVGKVWSSSPSHRLSSLSILLNVLDGDNIPAHPLASEIGTITPPLEAMGERIVAELMHQLSGVPLPATAPLMPQLKLGNTMRPPPA